MGLNKIFIVGTADQDAVLRYSVDDKPVSCFDIVVSKKWADHIGEIKEAFQIICYGSLAEFVIENVKKDVPLFVEGRLKITQVNVHKIYEVIAEKIKLINYETPTTQELLQKMEGK